MIFHIIFLKGSCYVNAVIKWGIFVGNINFEAMILIKLNKIGILLAVDPLLTILDFFSNSFR
ncbi:hypothetical protein CWR48_03260 [Oceanobacillus arenosus]|uniref:Uncharacterized protein n=1 Tax=Oceanobacillus arenosus TaxID=1229153 RepID=A0A3D8PZI8_9BACI|nr:hypothetical protein CWR48_03260 [Oceanobacillus arenosus]